MIAGCGSQLRVVTVPTPEGGLRTRPIGLDYTAVMLMGSAQGVNTRTLSEILPRIEAAIINPSSSEEIDE